MSDSELPVVTREATPFSEVGEKEGRWWTAESDGRILCQLCPRACHLRDGDRGFCFVRQNRNGKMVLDTYGRSTGFCIDPIEKKPLNHFLPGTPVLSFGTAGCNLGCKFCQNWDISKSREVARLSHNASPHEIARHALEAGCRSVAFTYNDPVIWAEYALDTAAACHELDLKTVAVTAGYLTEESRADFFEGMDAANIDLKAFTEDFYFKLTGAHLQPVLDTIRYACRETDCWVELTNLIIPTANDGLDDLKRMVDWLLDAVGSDVPVHFTAFHPDFRMKDIPSTSHETLIAAYDLARGAGLDYVYIGNVHDVTRQSTYCASCERLLIERDWHQLGRYRLSDNRCAHCNATIPGVFESTPGTWGRRRQPIQIQQTESTTPTPTRIASRSSPLQSQTSHSVNEDREKSGSGVSTENLAMKTPPLEASAPESESSLNLSVAALKKIHRTACEYVHSVLHPPVIDASERLGELAGHPVAGMYVTLKRGETLRGCCGMQGPDQPLASALADSATRTTLHDPRMAPISPAELPHLTLSVSIIGSPRPITTSGEERIHSVKVGQHGVRIRVANHVGLLLPVVAKERDWNARQFLDALCNKAGIPPGSWMRDDAVVEIFDGIDYSAPFSLENESVLNESALVPQETLSQLKNWVERNLTALNSGATPQFYASGVEDLNVAGVVLRVIPPGSDHSYGWLQFSVRDGAPLQATLFQLTETAARGLQRVGGAGHWRAEIGVLSQTIHHGLDNDCALQEVDPRRRSLIAMDGSRWSIAFDSESDTETLLQQTLSAQRFRAGGTMVYSTVCDSTESRFAISAGPQAQADVATRPPAVAGTFYPADDESRNQLVDSLLSDLSREAPIAGDLPSALAIMVPHAGLRYSGKIAADVWRRVQLPNNVLIIGPKHTRDGVDWAVSPHASWNLSDTCVVEANTELAHHIANHVTGMELDSAAHANEHGIEVQLPLLARIAPETKVTGVAMSGGSLQQLQAAARELADCLADFDDPPLLVISSDMNHFADETETRRRDRLALDRLSKLDPAGLLEVCRSENISMCGQLPAALVLLTLQAMGKAGTFHEIAYGTSADTSGDKSRVVGYAGVVITPS